MPKKSKATYRRRKKNGFTVPIAVVAPMGVIGLKGIQICQNIGLTQGLDNVSSWFTGYDWSENNFIWKRWYKGLFPMLIGIAAHRVATKVGLNRALANAGVPYIRI